MNLKKYIQQQADIDAHKLLTESDKEFCAQLAEDVCYGDGLLYAQLAENVSGGALVAQRNRRAKFWVILGGVLALVITTVIVLSVLLTKKPVVDIYYHEENIAVRVSDITELNNDLNYFEMAQPENTVLIYELNYDTVSNDHLYYTIKAYTEISEFNLIIDVNKNFNYEFRLSSELLSKQVDNYLINYQTIETDALSDIEAKYRGVIELNTEIVYIEYNQNIGLGDQAFFSDIQSVLKIK